MRGWGLSVEENGEEDNEEEVFQVDRNDNEHVTPMKVRFFKV